MYRTRLELRPELRHRGLLPAEVDLVERRREGAQQAVVERLLGRIRQRESAPPPTAPALGRGSELDVRVEELFGGFGSTHAPFVTAAIRAGPRNLRPPRRGPSPPDP